MTSPRPTRSRIGVLGTVFTAGFLVVVLHLWVLMVLDNETWARRSHENRWSFKSVPSQRGAVRDRFGTVLAYDEPTMQVAVHYVRFRLRHPVGSAVHGATTWARQHPGYQHTEYAYADGSLLPEDAVRDLLAMPARALRPRVLPKDVASELATAVTTVLSACASQARSRVFAAVRKAALGDGDVAVGDVLDVPRERLLAAFAHSLERLRQLDRDVQAEKERLAGHALAPDEDPGLFTTLEFLRRASLAGTRVTWVENGKERQGSRIEEVRRVFAPHVPFDLAADLRVGAAAFAGIDVLPSVRRVRAVEPDSTLHVLLGNVVGVDRSLPGRGSSEMQEQRQAAIARLLAREEPDEWLADLDSPEVDATLEDHARLQEDAREHFTRELVLRERRGVTGIERAFDDELMGRLGMRLVEHDSKRREQVLWSHLQVEAGEDVTLTLDLRLQQAAQAAAHAAWQRELHGDDRDRVLTEAAVAVIDARTGDVLAYAGAPITSPSVPDVPGVVWRGNGSLGSVVKPFVAVEQLHAERVGAAHRAIATFDACDATFRFGGTTLGCGHAHWSEGKNVVRAIAQSCNLFFYQAAIGLEEEGLRRGLRRFGLCSTPAGDPFAACWQGRVPGIPATAPTWDEATLLPRRAVGYGIQASPLHVARSYAAFATGWLPTLGLTLRPRPRVALDDVVGEMTTVEAGLRECVENGTADELPLLKELGVCGKTGTAQVGDREQNNAWFAGYLPPAGELGAQLCFCAVVYWVQDGQHGADAAGRLVSDLLAAMQADPELQARYLAPGTGR